MLHSIHLQFIWAAMHNIFNVTFSPPDYTGTTKSMAAFVVPVPVVIPFYVQKFRRDFPAVARCLDSMREKCVLAATRTGGSEA